MAVEFIKGLMYNLRVIWFPGDVPYNIFCDNITVLSNTQNQYSMINKKHLSTCYHFISDKCEELVVRASKESGKTNLLDCFKN